MYGKLFKILKEERDRDSLSSVRKRKGPTSLNIGPRKQAISVINQENFKMSETLKNVKCRIPTIS